MNFKDIPYKHIVEFLNLNYVNQYDYKTAIDLINNASIEIHMTKPIQLWLTAFEFKDQVKMTKQSDISYHYDLFDVKEKQDVIDILTYLHCYIDDSDYFSQLPYDLLTEILCYTDLKPFKQLSLSIYHYYKKVISNGWFRKRKCELMLIEKGYTDMNLFNIDYIYNTLVPKSGNVLYVNPIHHKLNFYEPIVKIVTQVPDERLVLTKTGKLLVHPLNHSSFSVTDINMIIDDILYFNDTYYYLSKGKIYYGDFNIINRFSYEGRSGQTTCHLKILTNNHIEIDNVMSMCCTKTELIYLKTNGEVYNLKGDFIMDHVLQIASIKYDTYILLSDGTVYNYEINKIKNIISGNHCLFIGEECYRACENTIEPIPKIKKGIYKKGHGVYLTAGSGSSIHNQGEVHYKGKNMNLQLNVVNLFEGHYDYDFYMIVDEN